MNQFPYFKNILCMILVPSFSHLCAPFGAKEFDGTTLIFFQRRCYSNNDQVKLPDKVNVVCSGMEGVYFPSFHL